MYIKLFLLIVNLFLIVNGQTTLEKLEYETNLDVFKENQHPIYTNVGGSLQRSINESYYSITAPGLLKSNRKYTIVASLHDSPESCTLRISISGRLFNATEEILLRPFESKTVNFYPNKLNYDMYTLMVEGIKGCSFKDNKQLLTDVDAGPNIYIQTDKAVYKPLDLIQFRVLFLDEHTRPLKITEPIQVEILDAKQNIVKSFKDVSFTKGVYTNIFALSESPVMGSWSIRVTVSGISSHFSSKSIQVQKYVLPKFSVHIKTPKHVVTSDPYIKAIIYGKYTFGKYVQGVATLQLWNELESKMWQEQKIDVNTLVGVEFPLANVKQFTLDSSLKLVVKLSESFTGITQNDTVVIMLHTQRYNIVADDNDFEFKGFEPYRVKVRIENWNGVAIVDRKTPVKFRHGGKTIETHMDENGVAIFEFENQHDESYSISYKDSNKYIPNLYQRVREYHDSEYYCKLKLLNERLRLGSPVKIEVSSSKNIPHLIYAVVGHSNIVHMNHIKLPPNLNNYTIHIKPSIEMVPVSFIYVHYSHNGFLRQNEMELVFPREFENQISLVAPQEVKPGEEIAVVVNALPQSFVAILAVDLGVHLLDPSYDLDRNEILNELNADRSYIFHEYIENGESLLSGLIILTNIDRQLEEQKKKKTIRESEEGPLNYRVQFPEVWIFENFEVNATKTNLTFKLPDSITTWRITAFSVNDKFGLGIVNRPTDVTAIKPFFISLNLPYSVKWGEIVGIPILVFNYHTQPLNSTIIMHNNEHEFEFMESLADGTEKCKNQQRQMVKSLLEANDGKVLTFYIKPLKVGNINLFISASNDLYSDAIQQQLKVESEGIEKKHNQPLYLRLDDANSTASTSLEVKMPSNVKPETSGISISVGGDYIVPILDNLQQLVEMPTGCGEQNMVNLAPNILVLQYLKATGEYRKEIQLVTTIKSYIDIGYQQQLSYRHASGGYSVFGEIEDEEASTWLTAYTIRFFIKASKFASIERRIIETGLDYLSKAQHNDGSFPYTGYLFDPAQQNRYGLTAFILTTFLEDRTFAKKYQNVIERSLQFLTTNLDNVDDAYALSLIAFALQMAKYSNVNVVLQKLQSHRNEIDGLVWWMGSSDLHENNVEITAYVLMVLLDSNTSNDLMPILKWLIKQRNNKGGFLSTHDTVVGLQALVKFSQKVVDEKNVNLNIKYTATNQQGDIVEKGALKVEPKSYLITQKQELPRSTRNVSFEMTGTGSALLQLSHHFKVLDAGATISPMISSTPKNRRKNLLTMSGKKNEIYFIIEPKVNILNKNDLDLEICYTYTTNSNMVVMEVNLPSGYQTDDEALKDLKNNAFVQKVEPRKAYTTIILYLDKLAVNEQNCINVAAYTTSDILQRKSVPIVMYDYYNTERLMHTFYTLHKK